MSAVEKQYGLIDVKTGKKLTVSDVFNNDSDSEGEQDSKWKKKPFQEEKGVKKQTKIEMQRALQQDPTVYQYDEIYDEMTQKKQELEQTKVCPEKKPKYIENLMKTAERRKKENERRLERQIQKEREAEGDMFKDKEEFITSSYKQKLEEFKKAEEEEKRMEYIESVMDVSKQQDLGGFYRHLYKETIPENDPGEKKEEESKEPLQTEGAKGEEKSVCEDADATKQERNYRKRHNSDSLDGEEKKIKQESSSSSSDSDSSSDSSSTSSSSDEEKGEGKHSEEKPEDSKKVEHIEKNKAEEEKSKLESKSTKPAREETRRDSKEEKSRNGVRSSKPDDRRDRSYRSGYERDRRVGGRREDKSYRDRDRERERERERDRDRERRDDWKTRDRGDRSSDSRRRRTRSPDRRNKSWERSSERSRSRRGQEKGREVKDMRSNEEKKKEAKEATKQDAKEGEEEKNEVQPEGPKVSIWEKRTVGPVFKAALERYCQRKAARSL